MGHGLAAGCSNAQRQDQALQLLETLDELPLDRPGCCSAAATSCRSAASNCRPCVPQAEVEKMQLAHVMPWEDQAADLDDFGMSLTPQMMLAGRIGSEPCGTRQATQAIADRLIRSREQALDVLGSSWADASDRAIECMSIELLSWLCAELWEDAQAAIFCALKERLEPQLDRELDRYGLIGRALKPIKITEFKLGDKPPALGPIKAWRQGPHEHNGIEIDCGIFLDCEPKIQMLVAGQRLGIERLVFQGVMTVIMKPLLKKVPLIGGVQFFLLHRPSLDFALSGVMQKMNGSLLHRIIQRVALDQMTNMIVLPSRFTLMLLPEWELGVDTVELEHPRPHGVLRIRVKSASNLPGADYTVASLLQFGSSSKKKEQTNSDPYCVIRVGSDTGRTPTMKKTRNPAWPPESSVFDFFVFNLHQHVDISIFDDDFGYSRDDFLGIVSVDVITLQSGSSHKLNLSKHTLEDEETSAICEGKKSVKRRQGTRCLPFRKTAVADAGAGGNGKNDSDPNPSVSLEVSSFNLKAYAGNVLNALRAKNNGHHEAVLGLKVYGMRPIGAHVALLELEGCTINVFIKDKSVDEAKAKSEDVPPPKVKSTKPAETNIQRALIEGVDENTVRFVHNLHMLQPQLGEQDIARIVELDVNIVRKVLHMKQSFPVTFNSGFHFMVGDATHDNVCLELCPKKGSSKREKDRLTATLEIPLGSVLQGDASGTLSNTFLMQPAENQKDRDRRKLTVRPAGTEMLAFEVSLELQVFVMERCT